MELCGLLNLFLAVILLAGCGGGGTPPGTGSAVLDLSHDGTLGYTFGANDDDQVKRFQTFIADTHQSIASIEVKIRKHNNDPYNNVSVKLYEMDHNHFPSILLAISTIDTDSLGTSFTVVNAPLTYYGLTAWKSYAIVLGQTEGANFNDSGYEWCTKGLSDNFYFGKYNGNAWTDESFFGDGWLKVHVDNSSGTNSFVPGHLATYMAGSTSFDAHYVPEATIPGSSPVSNAFWMANTEVTLGLWNTVYHWATTDGHGYTFSHTGAGSTDQYPVNGVSWRDVIVWCNALSEMTGLTPVYKNGGVIVRDSTNATLCDGVSTPTASDKGFRLPSSMEWELAARYRDGSNWTPLSYASGATADYTDPVATGTVAWYTANSGNIAHVVGTTGSSTPSIPKTGNHNALGLYDMSGNLWEWCFDSQDLNRKARGGSYINPADVMRISWVLGWSPSDAWGNLGFRLVRTN